MSQPGFPSNAVHIIIPLAAKSSSLMINVETGPLRKAPRNTGAFGRPNCFVPVIRTHSHLAFGTM
jgi:hypothetical protein